MKRATDTSPTQDRGQNRIEPQLCLGEVIRTLLAGLPLGGPGLDVVLDRIERMP